MDAELVAMRSYAMLSSALALPFLALACGGAVSGLDGNGGTNGNPPGAQGPSPDGGISVESGQFDLEGSYDLSFTKVDAKLTAGGPTPPPSSPPSLTRKARLDLRKVDGSLVAAFTGRWEQASHYTASFSGSSVVLNADASSGATIASSDGVTDSWTQIVLTRAPNGKLTGAFTATGDESIGQGDVIWQAKLAGSGSFAKDTTDPELRANLSSRIGPSDALLPWDPILVDVAEPVNAYGVWDQTVMKNPSGRTMPLAGDANAFGVGWEGGTRYALYVPDWGGATAAQPWTLQNSGGKAADLVGRVSAPLSVGVKFLGMGPPTQNIGFDDDVLFASMWGEHAIYGGGLTGQTDARCEAGGCLRIGPVRYDVCNTPVAGFAGYLQRLAGNKVELRYRILLKAAYPDGPSPVLYGDAFTLQLATPAEPARDHGAQLGAIAALPAPIDGMTHGTPWQSVEVTMQGIADVLGAAVAIGGAYRSRGGCGGPPVPPVEMEILVEYLRSK